MNASFEFVLVVAAVAAAIVILILELAHVTNFF
jgi:hypothetical protein